VSRAAVLALGVAIALGGCDLTMTRQARHATLDSPTLWPGGPAAGPPPAGALAEDAEARAAALAAPPPLTPALLARGQDRYGVYCTPCHGERGEGDGPVVRRGFPRPPAYAEPRLLAAPARHFVEVIGEGYGVMYGYGDRVEPADRWAIAAYIRALQRAAQPAGRG
jgi:mono/diheme cytochrome c family protein